MESDGILFWNGQYDIYWKELDAMDYNTLEDLPEGIEWIKFTGAAWQDAAKCIYYLCYVTLSIDDSVDNCHEIIPEHADNVLSSALVTV